MKIAAFVRSIDMYVRKLMRIPATHTTQTGETTTSQDKLLLNLFNFMRCKRLNQNLSKLYVLHEMLVMNEPKWVNERSERTKPVTQPQESTTQFCNYAISAHTKFGRFHWKLFREKRYRFASHVARTTAVQLAKRNLAAVSSVASTQHRRFS